MDIDPKTSITALVRMVVKRFDGALLIALIFTFLAFAAFPTVTATLGLVRDDPAAVGMRLAFLIMPVVLIAEYFWFLPSTGKGRHSLLLCAVLLATASIPFLNTLKGIHQ